MFDPYEQWLGISKEARPINYYVLLGVSRKESDSGSIDAAAKDRAELVRKHENGNHAAISARILKEIANARAVLLNANKRREYDLRLRQIAGKNQADAEGQDNGESGRRPRKRPDGNVQRKSSSLGLWLAIGGIAAVLVLGGGAAGGYFLFIRKGDVASTAPMIASDGIPKAPPSVSTSEKDLALKSQPTTKASQATPPTTPTATATVPAAPVKPAVSAPPKPRPPAVAKLPVPDAQAEAKAEAALKDVYKAEFSKNRPEDKLALATMLLQPGREDRNNPADWFVLLRVARDLAVQVGKPRLAVEAINELDRWFVINALDMKIKALADSSKSGNEVSVAASYRVGLNLIQQAYDAENIDAARGVIEIVDSAVKEIKSPDLDRLVQNQRFEIDGYAKEFQAVTLARSKLATSPDDPAANLTVGRYLCFFQGDWSNGLPMLARGSDAALKTLATKDLAQPNTVKEQLEIADGWWNWGAVQKDREQRLITKQAKSWYAKAGPASAGQDRANIINRILEAQKKEYARIRRLQPGSYYGRDPENRTILLREGGGSMQSEEAVERGLEWLSKHQSSNGIWPTDVFHKVGEKACNCGNHGEKHDVAGTALGMMPFLGAGETHKSGRYRNQIDRALLYLIRQQDKKQKGNFHDNAYENALATIAVVELYGLTKDTSLKIRAQAAVNYLVQSQFTDGSWGYSAGTKGDSSVSGWQFTALKAAAYAKLDVPVSTFDRLSLFLDAVADTGGTGYGYNSPGNGPATSAVGILCREFLSWGPGHPGLIKEVDFLLRPDTFPTKDKISIYSVFYITQVAHHFGGHHWEEWNARVRDLLIDLQDKGDNPKQAHQKGSWTPPPGEPHAKQGGRLMYTTLALITLESYYYHIPLYAYGPYTLLD
jgi:hypothetical protein